MSPKRCVILCAGPVGPVAVARCAISPEDYLIAADGGYLTADRLGLVPNLILGDFDSAPLPVDRPALHYPEHKDDTDSLLAVKEGLDRGHREFVLLGGTGGRLDHTLANLQTLLYLKNRGGNGLLLDEEHTIRLLMEERWEVERFEGYLSLFAMGGRCHVTLEGMEYPLNDYLLTPSYPLGVSNHVVEPRGTVTTRGGVLIAVEYRAVNN